MKRALSILLTACIIFSALSVSSYASYTSEEVTLNFDYNGDGVVNLADARTVLRVLANLEAPKDGMIYDLTGNGDGLTLEDVKKVIGIVTGIDADVSECAEFNLALFKAELNNVKKERPGFTKTSTAQCSSMLVTTKNAPVDELNVTNMEFSEYTEKSCKYMEDLIDKMGILISKDQEKEMRAQIAELRKQAKEMYEPQTTEKTVNRFSNHAYYFPINSNLNSCLLTIDDIKSIVCYEEDGYIIREVTMNDDTYVGDEFPTGPEGSSQRLKTVSYAKVFNIPDFDETEGTKKTSNLNKVIFKDGKIISKVDKISGLPVSVEYSYSYIADVSTIPEKDENGKDGIQMDSVTKANSREICVINPIPKT